MVLEYSTRMVVRSSLPPLTTLNAVILLCKISLNHNLCILNMHSRTSINIANLKSVPFAAGDDSHLCSSFYSATHLKYLGTPLPPVHVSWCARSHNTGLFKSLLFNLLQWLGLDSEIPPLCVCVRSWTHVAECVNAVTKNGFTPEWTWM